MKANVILAGVGGQGVLSLAYCLGNAARKRGLTAKQSEVHGMAQRGGAVVSHLRISPQPIYSDLVPQGTADLVLSVEPLEALRYVHYLSPSGTVVASSSPVMNISDYPDLNELLERMAGLPHHVLVDANYLANVAGSGRASNMVILGAGGVTLGFSLEELDEQVQTMFAGKSERVLEVNRKALRLGTAAAHLYTEKRSAGATCVEALQGVASIPLGELLESACRAGVGNSVKSEK